jgi:hypothetical protein
MQSKSEFILLAVVNALKFSCSSGGGGGGGGGGIQYIHSM